jgi:HPt (histidine-containing phosphotransfer) domain-containing protein
MDDLYAQMIDGFAVDAPALLQTLDSDLTAGRLDTGLRLVHTLKGLAAMVAALRLTEIATTGQDEWKEGVSMDRGRKLQQELTACLADTLPVLAAIRTGLPY